MGNAEFLTEYFSAYFFLYPVHYFFNIFKLYAGLILNETIDYVTAQRESDKSYQTTNTHFITS